MGVTVLFGVIGAEVKVAQNQKGGMTEAATAPSKVLLGGVVATALLTGISHFGDAGRQFAVGLALVTMATATLVYGGPVWEAANNKFGSTPTKDSAGTTPTTPGTNTAASAATIALAAGG